MNSPKWFARLLILNYFHSDIASQAPSTCYSFVFKTNTKQFSLQKFINKPLRFEGEKYLNQVFSNIKDEEKDFNNSA